MLAVVMDFYHASGNFTSLKLYLLAATYREVRIIENMHSLNIGIHFDYSICL